MKRLFFTALLLLISAGAAISSEVMTQGFIAFKTGDEIKIMGDYDRKVYFTSFNASEALQYALDQLAEDGGELEIGNGRYYLESPLILYDNIKLSGKGRSTKLTISEKNREGTGILCKGINAALITGLTLSAGNNPDARTGIVIDNCGDVKIQGIYAVGFSDYGLWMRNSSFLCEISNCSFAGNRKANIYLSKLRYGRIGNFIPNLISDCTIYGGGKGIECNEVIVLNIVGCILYQTRDVGFHLHTGSNSVLISGCRTFQISNDAVRVEDTHELNITGNIFCWHTGHGIFVRNSAWGSISGNNIIDNGSYNPGGPAFDTKMSDIKKDIPLKNGVCLSAVRGYQVTGNAIFNWSVVPKMKYGILENGACFKNIITGNNINYYEEGDVLSLGEATTIANNSGFGESTYFEMQDLEMTSFDDDQFWQGSIQSFQPELVQDFIESLK